VSQPEDDDEPWISIAGCLVFIALTGAAGLFAGVVLVLLFSQIFGSR
jgi:hypothetical protein